MCHFVFLYLDFLKLLQPLLQLLLQNLILAAQLSGALFTGANHLLASLQETLLPFDSLLKQLKVHRAARLSAALCWTHTEHKQTSSRQLLCRNMLNVH